MASSNIPDCANPRPDSPESCKEERMKLLEVLFRMNHKNLQLERDLEKYSRLISDLEKSLPRYNKLKKHFLKYLVVFYSGSIVGTAILVFLIHHFIK